MMSSEPISIIVAGGLNTDVVGVGVDRLLNPGELTMGGELRIGPGGKARNMAQMAAAWLGPGRVAMIGKTSRDPFGLWRVPLDALNESGVDTRHVKVLDFEEADKVYPGIALIPVDRTGGNQIYVLPGINAGFGPDDVDGAGELFERAEERSVLLMALEIPLATVDHCLDKAAARGMPVILDPGGAAGPLDEMLDGRITLIKPNVHEAGLLTGVEVGDFKSAGLAAGKLMAGGVSWVLITHGENGGYLFGDSIELHIQIPPIPASETLDETGCGDQVTAVVASCLAEGRDVVEAARLAVSAGTLQFHRYGIQPVTRGELFDTLNGA